MRLLVLWLLVYLLLLVQWLWCCLWYDVTRSSSAGTILSLVICMIISLLASKAWSYSHLQVSFLGITISSPWELPHRVVHLNKGEGKMVFQHWGYGFYICVGRVFSEVLEEEFIGLMVSLWKITLSRMKFLCCVVQFVNPNNKLQPAGSNRVSPACSFHCHTMYT